MTKYNVQPELSVPQLIDAPVDREEGSLAAGSDHSSSGFQAFLDASKRLIQNDSGVGDHQNAISSLPHRSHVNVPPQQMVIFNFVSRLLNAAQHHNHADDDGGSGMAVNASSVKQVQLCIIV